MNNTFGDYIVYAQLKELQKFANSLNDKDMQDLTTNLDLLSDRAVYLEQYIKRTYSIN